MRKKILIISFSEISSDPRVKRQVNALNKKYDITVVGFGEPPSEKCEFKKLTAINNNYFKIFSFLLMALGLHRLCYWVNKSHRECWRICKNLDFDLVLSNDIQAVPVAFGFSNGRPVCADLHEYSPLEFENKRLWRFTYQRYYEYISKIYLPNCSYVTTVAKGIADAYFDLAGIECDLIFNCPKFEDLTPTAVESGAIDLIHHGAAIRSRKLEIMFDLMDQLDDRFILHLMLIPSDESYFFELIKKAKGRDDVHFIKPVPTEHIPRKINQFDIGIFLLPPVNFNYKYALPNKFFEFIQARLAVAIGPSIEMKNFSDMYKLGVICNDFSVESFADMLNSLSASDIARLKLESHNSASKLSFDAQADRFLAEINQLLM